MSLFDIPTADNLLQCIIDLTSAAYRAVAEEYGVSFQDLRQQGLQPELKFIAVTFDCEYSEWNLVAYMKLPKDYTSELIAADHSGAKADDKLEAKNLEFVDLKEKELAQALLGWKDKLTNYSLVTAVLVGLSQLNGEKFHKLLS